MNNRPYMDRVSQNTQLTNLCQGLISSSIDSLTNVCEKQGYQAISLETPLKRRLFSIISILDIEHILFFAQHLRKLCQFTSIPRTALNESFVQ